MTTARIRSGALFRSVAAAACVASAVLPARSRTLAGSTVDGEARCVGVTSICTTPGKAVAGATMIAGAGSAADAGAAGQASASAAAIRATSTAPVRLGFLIAALSTRDSMVGWWVMRLSTVD